MWLAYFQRNKPKPKPNVMAIKLSLIVFMVIEIKTAMLLDNEINLKCFGRKYDNVTLTAYCPIYDDEDDTKAFQDARGDSLRTLQDYMDTRNDFVTLAMDKLLGIPYGAAVCIPELNEHFGHRLRMEVRDTSDDLTAMGYSRADVCVRSEADSYDITVNRQVTLVFVE